MLTDITFPFASNFGVRSLSQPQNLQRWYTVENGIEVQHTLTSGLSVSGSFVRGDFRDMPMSYNSLVAPADYTPVQIYHLPIAHAYPHLVIVHRM